MSQGLRVLYLAPSARQPDQLSRYSFLDEEIRALAAAGVDAYVIAPAGFAGGSWDDRRLHVRALPPDCASERRHAALFAARNLPNVPAANLLDPGHCYRALRTERFAAEIVRRERIDVIHSYFGSPGGFGGSVTRSACRVPLVAALRGADVNMSEKIGYGARRDRSYDRAIRRLLRNADATLFVSEFLRRNGQALGARTERSRVILKGVSLERFYPRPERHTLRKRLGFGEDRPVILAVGGLVAVKGLRHVIQALGRVRPVHDFLFVACGEGPDLRALQEAATDFGLGDRALFKGRVSRAEIPEMFAAADVFVHGSIIEASGNVLLEAMASGVPTVCTDAGGPAEYVADGSTGFVVPVGNVEAMAARVGQLLGDAGLRTRMGLAARTRAETEFSYDRMIADTIAVYGELMHIPPEVGMVSAVGTTKSSACSGHLANRRLMTAGRGQGPYRANQ